MSVDRAGEASPRILILTAAYGSGHDTSARALSAGFAAAGARPRIVDHFRELVHPLFECSTRRLYNAILRCAPALWSAAYRLSDRMDTGSPTTLHANRLGAARLERLLQHERPDALVCTHPTPAGALAALRARGLRTPPLTLVYTDFAVHNQWIQPDVDTYCVPAESIKHELVARGVPRARVLVTGIPLRREFAAPIDQAVARVSLGFDPDRPLVLAMAGTFAWMGRLAAVARVMRALPPSVQGVVVAGRDATLRARLCRLARGAESRLRVLGYTTNVPHLMAAADLLVTKAGGISIAESLAAELPIVCFGSLPGHETRNERFAVTSGIALPARSTRELDRVLRSATGDRPGIVDDLRAGIAALRRPHATRDIVRHVLATAAAGPSFEVGSPPEPALVLG